MVSLEGGVVGVDSFLFFDSFALRLKRPPNKPGRKIFLIHNFHFNEMTGGETVQLACESHLSWLQAARRGAKAGFAGYNSISKHGKIFGSINLSGKLPNPPPPPHAMILP